MNWFQEFLNTYGSTILYTLITTFGTAILSFIGLKIKAIYEKISTDKIKKSVAKTCVEAIEQIYKDLHGEEKYEKCVEAVTAMLNQKGITVTDLEIKMLIESAVKQLNLIFKIMKGEGDGQEQITAAGAVEDIDFLFTDDDIESAIAPTDKD